METQYYFDVLNLIFRHFENFWKFDLKISYIIADAAAGLSKYVWPFCYHQALKG